MSNETATPETPAEPTPEAEVVTAPEPAKIQASLG